MYVSLSENNSECLSMSSGVLQGSVFGPLLFDINK